MVSINYINGIVDIIDAIVYIFSLIATIKLVKSKNELKGYRILTIAFQQVIIIGFFLFVLLTSNPFNYLFPAPIEGLGLNPILQDPALAIHPPILYVGYVGSSLIFSATLAAVIENYISKNWAKNIKIWILISWVFLTIGIISMIYYLIFMEIFLMIQKWMS